MRCRSNDQEIVELFYRVLVTELNNYSKHLINSQSETVRAYVQLEIFINSFDPGSLSQLWTENTVFISHMIQANIN